MNTMKLLVVEDEQRIAQAIKTGLEQEHHTVDVVHTGTAGLDFAISEEYDLIILDRMLPEMDGLAVCTALRAQAIQTPILMLTAKSQIQDKVIGLDAGADDYLSKPFAFDELLARIRALARRPQQVTTTTLSVADLELDPKTFQVSRGGIPITLSSKEFALLEYLLRHPGKISTKQHIINQVWEFDTDILPNTVEVYIRNLRKKVDAPFPKKPNLIQTVRGFGYTLKE